jgi:hypothetical protein
MRGLGSLCLPAGPNMYGAAPKCSALPLQIRFALFLLLPGALFLLLPGEVVIYAIA